MCGRYVLEGPQSRYQAYFDAKCWPEAADRYNIAPTSIVPVIRQSPEGERLADLLKWGLIPHWAKDPSIGLKLTNARAESLTEKPSFRDAFKRRRCIVPASGFYEWKAETAGKQPYYIRSRSEVPLAMAGLWESWRDPEGVVVRTFCIITTEANTLMAQIHQRMPVLLRRDDFARWLNPAVPGEQLRALLEPYPAELLDAWPVSKAVSRASNEGVELIKRAV